MISLLLCTGFVAVVSLPGVGLVALVDRESRWARAIGVGATAGVAAAILGGYYCLRARVPFAYFLFGEYLALGAALAIRPRRKSRDRSPAVPTSDGFAGASLPALLALVFVSRCVPLFFSEIPPGFDPSFHALIARKILDAGTIPTDWLPFEAVKLHYPVGSHILIAETARFAHDPVHIVFKDLFPVLACLTTLSMYCVGSRLLRSRQAAWYAAVAYSFLAVWGSLDYYRWGGLPNLLGMLFLLGLVETAFATEGPLSVALFALLLASLVVSHHHSALCAMVLFLGYGSFVAFLGRPLARPARTIACGAALGALLSLVPLIGYLRAASDVARTSVLRFYEPFISLGDAVLDLGVPLGILGSLGTIALFRARKRPETLFLAFWIAALFASFVLLEYVYRFGAYLAGGEFYTALTPSRFLTDLAYPLSIAAAYPLQEVAQRWKRSAAPAAILAASLAWAYFPIRAQCAPADPEIDITAFRWVATHAEENAFVVSDSRWAPYFTWREGTYTPLPASEARNDERVLDKRRLLLGDAGTMASFSRASRRAVYVFAPSSLRQPSGGPADEVYRGERTAVYKISG